MQLSFEVKRKVKILGNKLDLWVVVPVARIDKMAWKTINRRTYREDKGHMYVEKYGRMRHSIWNMMMMCIPYMLVQVGDRHC